ncbi:MAG: peptide chain release factor N(5)-glutamine methyltransferase [Calditrichaceae bacterium]|nr:peptide chain release factor N(5)-glutamine methyltransferase [Calditrichaceae bacterium]HES58909.1 peptide chain release factor N(5)-glutamine methyltransferase [Caldithrix sp.]
MQSKKNWTLLELLNTTTQYFTDKNIDNPRLNAEELLGKILNLNRVQLYVAFERPLTDKEVSNFRELVKRRIQREPLQHILGQTEFMGYPFIVNPHVLIPRPETEILVEEVLKLQDVSEFKNPTILDIGTGSGCIAISLALEWKGSRLMAVDLSKAALETAYQNCQINNISAQMEYNQNQDNDTLDRLTLLEHDILKPWPQSITKQFDIIVSNPPYVTNDEMKNLQPEVRDYEPQNALTDSVDGLTFYRHIFDMIAEKHELECRYLFLEMSGSQPDKIIELARKHKFEKIEVIPDLNKIDRVLKIEV